MQSPTRPQIGLVLAIVAVAVIQVCAVTFAAIPTNRVSEKLSSTTAYLDPFFTQDWRLFAPNPVSEDRTVWFRGEYGADGQTKTTDWIDWTSVELDLVHHRFVGGRAGYITNKMIGPLNTQFFALGSDQREVAAGDRSAGLAGHDEFRKRLIAAGGNPRRVDLYLRYEAGITHLGTSVLEAAHPGTEFTALRYRIVRRPVVSYDNRTLPAAQRELSRPPAEIRRSGWRKPIPTSAAQRRTVAEFLARHG